jgi:tetratricopeptide (TPR) repeat protein
MNGTMRILPYVLLLGVLASCGGTKPMAGSPVPAETEGVAPMDDRQATEMRLFMDATNAKLQGDPGKAVQLYQAALKVDPSNAAAMFELAKLLHQSQRGNEALAYAKKAVATDKENIWYRFLLADLSTQLGDLSGAAKTYQGILDQWPDRYEVYFGLADILAKQGKIAEARKVYSDLQKRTGPSDELVMREYDMLVGANELEGAKDLLEQALAADPEETRYYGMLADVYQELGNKDKALELYKKAVTTDPDDSMARISLAQFYYDEGKLDEGFEQLREAFADPDLDIDPKMQLLLGFYQMTGSAAPDSTQKTIEAQSHALIAVMKKAHPSSGKPWSIEGDFFMRENKPQQARASFREALVHEQDKFPIWSALLQLDYQLADWDTLHLDAAKAAELFPTQPEIFLYNGIALSQLKRYDEAIEALVAGRDLVVDNKPMESQFWGLLGDAYNSAKNFAKSDEAYGKALAINDSDASVLNNWAYYLSERGEHLEKAEQMSSRSNQLAPGIATYMDTYAWILYKQGQYAKAKEWQEKALRAEGKDEGVLLEHYGDILYKLGDKAGALEQWKKAKAAGSAGELIDRKIQEGILVE